MPEKGLRRFAAGRTSICGELLRGHVRHSLMVRALVLSAAMVAVFGMAGVVPVHAGQADADPIGDGHHRSSPYFGDMDPVLRHRQLRALNVARQQELVRDTVKLLKLAKDLNAEITTAQPAHLSPEELSKVIHIEKLARSVREKMCQTVSGGPSIEDPIAQPFR